MLFLFACSAPDDVVPPDSEEDPVVATALPPHGGCTFVETQAAFGTDLTRTTVYDDQERAVSVYSVEDNTNQSVEYTYTYDGDCQAGYREEWRSGRSSQVFEWTGTCDASGRNDYRVGTYDGTFYEIVYDYTYDDAGNMVAYAATLTFGDSVSEYAGEVEYVDDLPVRAVATKDGEFDEEERWTWAGDLLVLYENDQPDPAESNTTATTYDAYGREVELHYTYGGEPSGATYFTWMDAQYHTSRAEYEVSGTDGLLTTTWTCGDTFPWVCEGEGDGMDGSEPDGAVDTLVTETWTCP